MAPLVAQHPAILQQAAAVLADALHADGPMVHAFPQERSRPQRLAALMRFLVGYCHRHGEVHVTSEQCEGVALWLPSARKDFGIGESLRSGALSAVRKAGIGGMLRLSQISAHDAKNHLECIQGEHWYLNLLGVAPEHQGKGLGRELTRHMLERLEQERLPCILETQDPRTVRFFESLGFDLSRESTYPKTELRTWYLVKGCPTVVTSPR